MDTAIRQGADRRQRGANGEAEQDKKIKLYPNSNNLLKNDYRLFCKE